jgi:hypothetical protein
VTEILAILDDTSDSNAVCDTALAVSDLLDAGVSCVEPDSDTFSLARALASADVLGAVMAGRASDGIPSNRSARSLMLHATKPVVVVPDRCRNPGPIRRLLAPLDAGVASAAPLETFLRSCADRPVELLPFHVFTAASTPPFLDRPYYDLPDFGREMLRRRLPGRDAGVRWATGIPPRAIAESCRPAIADAVVLSWSQLLWPGHAVVVRAVLRRSELPVVLLPLVSTPGDPDEDSAIDLVDLVDLVEDEAAAPSGVPRVDVHGGPRVRLATSERP